MRQSIEHIILYSSLAFVLVSIVFSSGIVWRTEQRLDASYKFFTLALLFLVLQLGIETFGSFVPRKDQETVRLFLQFFLTFFLLLGFWEMRMLVRELDGEKRKQEKSKKNRRRERGSHEASRQ